MFRSPMKNPLGPYLFSHPQEDLHMLHVVLLVEPNARDRTIMDPRHNMAVSPCCELCAKDVHTFSSSQCLIVEKV